MALFETVVDQTVEAMIANQYRIGDKTAIRTISNDVVDSLEKDGAFSRKQTNRLSQDKIIKAVQKEMKRKLLNYGE